MEKRTVPPPPPFTGSNLSKEQKFIYVDSYGAACDLNAHLEKDWKFILAAPSLYCSISMVGTGKFAIVLLERTVRGDAS
jgi:hypothetical protein